MCCRLVRWNDETEQCRSASVRLDSEYANVRAAECCPFLRRAGSHRLCHGSLNLLGACGGPCQWHPVGPSTCCSVPMVARSSGDRRRPFALMNLLPPQNRRSRQTGGRLKRAVAAAARAAAGCRRRQGVNPKMGSGGLAMPDTAAPASRSCQQPSSAFCSVAHCSEESLGLPLPALRMLPSPPAVLVVGSADGTKLGSMRFQNSHHP